MATNSTSFDITIALFCWPTHQRSLFFQFPLPKWTSGLLLLSTNSPSFKTEQSENAERGTCPSIRNEQKSMTYGDTQLALAVKNTHVTTQETWDPGSIPGSGRFPGGGHGNPLQYSCLKNPMHRGVWQATVRGVTKSSTWLEELSMQAHTMQYV